MPSDVELPDALPRLAIDGVHNVEAQSIVTDFLDYTEYLPSDLIRSFTLIRQLDEAYEEATAKVHNLTALYGKLPQIAAAERPNAQQLRANISRALEQATSCREASSAEAIRIRDVVKKHRSRLDLIKSKLQALPKPPSRDPTPPPASPKASRSKKKQLLPKLRLTLSERKAQKNRVHIPGDVLPQKEIEDIYEVSADEEEEVSAGEEEDAQDVVAAIAKPLKTPKTPKIPKTPKERRPVVERERSHHKVIGISTTNALAMLTPPPENAPAGSKYRPWLKLTDWELARIRKQMKKSVTWLPSEAMHRRVLEEDGRGPDAWVKAKLTAEAKNEAFLDEQPEIKDRSPLMIDVGRLAAVTPGPITSTGTRLNESKKLKKDRAKEAEAPTQLDITIQAVPDAEPMEIVISAEKEESNSRPQTRRATQQALQLDEVNKAITNLPLTMRNVFTSPVPPTPIKILDKPILETRTTRKRKRESVKDTPTQSSKVDSTSPRQESKKQKTEKPAAVKITIKPQETPVEPPSPVTVTTTTISVPLAPEGPSSPLSPLSPLSEPETQIESIELKPDTTITIQPTAVQTRSRRTSLNPREAASKASSPKFSTSTPIIPPIRASTRARAATATTKAASAEPPPSRRELRETRRLSINDETTPSATSQSKTAAPRATRSGGRRPVPGLVTAEDNGKNKVSMGRRKAKPNKKAANKKADGGSKLVEAEEEDEENYDPDEPTYCICDDVSYGTMIACENNECEKEWFHLQCIGLEEIPPRRVKWYCPLCREKLHVDEKGNAQSEPVATTSTGRRR